MAPLSPSCLLRKIMAGQEPNRESPWLVKILSRGTSQPDAFSRELSAQLPDNFILTSDSCFAANWFARDLKIRRGMMASLPGTLATMGPGYRVQSARSRSARTVATNTANPTSHSKVRSSDFGLTDRSSRFGTPSGVLRQDCRGFRADWLSSRPFVQPELPSGSSSVTTS